MRSLLALGVLAAFIAPAAATAADVPIKPLRTLVYEVQSSAHSSHEKKTSGFNGGYGVPGNGVGVSAGNGTAGVGLDGTDSGTLTIEVIAATPDGGLVVDSAYAGKLSNQPKIRVALYPDGRLGADPTKPLGPEAMHVLPLLARGFIANRDVSPGSTWAVTAPAPAKGTTTYRVQTLNGDQATIALEGSISLPGVNGFDETDRGTTTYATNLISPVSYDINARIHRQLGVDESITTDTHLKVTLVSDTFVKK
ncbi:MAG TPA: hypothetical protein VGX96_04835 [Candidatus Elarobacter sp.]|jgi:hypothetical protein|nr:hypothetical protein [Candidatus Elarobacter sp.]